VAFEPIHTDRAEEGVLVEFEVEVQNEDTPMNVNTTFDVAYIASYCDNLKHDF
jgi:hypothetical protein